MFKALLRTLPSLNGNVKLACDLMDYHLDYNDKSKKEIYITNIRGAKLVPLSSDKFQYSFNINLLNSSYEYDIKSYYKYYRDIFYSGEYNSFLHDDLQKLDLTTNNTKFRNTDFEFGCKRISWTKNNQEYAFFAPIYCDSIDDLPDYFLITIEFIYNTNLGKESVLINKNNKPYKVTKYIKVQLNQTADKYQPYNYIKPYITKYFTKIDGKVGFCLPSTYQNVFYGIDVKNGGFTKVIDNKSGGIYNKHNTINNFDATITGSFERNNIIMKQILPLCYYFNIDNILSKSEKEKYNFSQIKIYGHYYKNDAAEDFYDFSTDYYNYKPSIYKLNDDRTKLVWCNDTNVIDINFPSLNEKYYTKYQFTNKLSPWYCRWKMRYTDDDNPYILNMSYAFSVAQNDNYRYYTFPYPYKNIPFIVDDFDNAKERTIAQSLYLPYTKYKDKYTVDNKYTDEGDIEHIDKYILYPYDKYHTIMNKYYSNWFDAIISDDYNIQSILDLSTWEDVIDNKVFYRGILYDFNNIYQSYENVPRITKFNVILGIDYINTITFNSNVNTNIDNPNDINLSILLSTESSDYIYSDSAIKQLDVSDNIENACYLSDVYTYDNTNNTYQPAKLYSNDERDTSNRLINSTVSEYMNNVIMKYAGDTEDDSDNVYVDISPDFYDMNRWYTFDNAEPILRSSINSSIEEYVKEYIRKYIENDKNNTNNIDIDNVNITIDENQIKLNNIVEDIKTNCSITCYDQVQIFNFDNLRYYKDKEHNDDPNYNRNLSIRVKKDIYNDLKSHDYYIYDHRQSENCYKDINKVYDEICESIDGYDINSKYDFMLYKQDKFISIIGLCESIDKILSKPLYTSGIIENVSNEITRILNINNPEFGNDTGDDNVDDTNNDKLSVISSISEKIKDTFRNNIIKLQDYYTYYPIYKKLGLIHGKDVMIKYNENYGNFYGNHIKYNNYINTAELNKVNDVRNSIYNDTLSIPSKDIIDASNQTGFPNLTNDNQGILLVDSYNMDTFIEKIDNITNLNEGEVISDIIYQTSSISIEDSYFNAPNFKDTNSWVKVNIADVDNNILNPGVDIEVGEISEVDTDATLNDTISSANSSTNKPTITGPSISILPGLSNDFIATNEVLSMKDASYIAAGIASDKISLQITDNTIQFIGGDLYEDTTMVGKVVSTKVYNNQVNLVNDFVKIQSNNATYKPKDTDTPNIVTISLEDIKNELINYGYSEYDAQEAIKNYNDVYIKHSLVPSWVKSNLSNKIQMFGRFCNKKHLYVYCTRLQETGWMSLYKVRRVANKKSTGDIDIYDEYTRIFGDGSSFNVFSEWYTKVLQDDLTIEIDGIIYDVVYRGEFYQVNKTIFENIMLHIETDNDTNKKESTGFTDLYLYYGEQSEYSESPIYYLNNDNSADSSDSKYKYTKNVNIISGENEQAYTLKPGRIAIPLFDYVYQQKAKDTIIYKESNLYKIKTVAIKNDANDVFYRYRYNMNDSVMFIQEKDKNGEHTIHFPDADKYGFYRRYNLFDTAKININPYQDLYKDYINTGKEIEINDSTYKLYNYDNLYILEPTNDGNVYGFYYMTTTLNNTFNYLNMIDKDYNTIQNIWHINDFDIVSSDKKDVLKFLLENIRAILVCSNIDLYTLLYNINTIIIPQLYSYDTIYRAYPTENKNVNILLNKDYTTKITLMRYFDDITPLITKCNKFENLWMLKYKTCDANILDKAIYNETNDTPIYHDSCNIYDYPGILVQNSLKENVNDYIFPFEYKYYNDNHLVYLKKEFSINCYILDKDTNIKRNTKRYELTYDEVLKQQERAFELFSSYVDKYTTETNQLRNLFLFKKYNVKYDSVCIGLNQDKTEKLYTLTLRFELL